jgi:hypothetical protein
MLAQTILTRLTAQKISIRAIDGNLEVTPASLLTADLRAEIVAHKSELLSLLSANEQPRNRHQETHAAVKAFYLSHGRTEDDWQKVNNDPAKFNYVWRLMLGMEPNGKPPYIKE